MNVSLWMNVFYEWLNDLLNELVDVCFFYWVRITVLLKNCMNSMFLMNALPDQPINQPTDWPTNGQSLLKRCEDASKNTKHKHKHKHEHKHKHRHKQKFHKPFFSCNFQSLWTAFTRRFQRTNKPLTWWTQDWLSTLHTRFCFAVNAESTSFYRLTSVEETKTTARFLRSSK